MHILFAQKWGYFPNVGGGSRSQRLMIEGVANRGHRCDVLTPDWLGTGAVRVDRARAEATGVRLHLASGPMADALESLIHRLQPDLVVLPNDDEDWALLRAALRAAPGRVVCFVHTLQQLPFGPAAFARDAAATDALRECARVISVSEAAKSYLLQEGGIESVVVLPQVYDDYRHADPVAGGRAVLLINPCPYKGIDIFLELARRLPQHPFLAVPGWATTDADRRRLAAEPNVRILPGYSDAREVLGSARLVLMPSLCAETFGYTSVEAMLLGVPVVASAICGLAQAKLGVPHSLEVDPIVEYLPSGPQWRPDCVVPPQDIEPWLVVVRSLLEDDTQHTALSARSRTAARAFANSIDPAALTTVLATTAAAAGRV
ncbi:glycosyltransferase family 4 protein [Microbacteriaceae bacterium VKM Ac-2854]|nr:glycosyltransferase family 4 protein [Microbacteriaceae bacterium VKM Ac-2854]